MNARTSVLYVEHQYEDIAFKALSALLVVLLCAYLYCVCVSILNVTAGKEAALSAMRTGSHIATLEQQYFALSQQVTEAQGERLGLVPLSHTDYVNRQENTRQAQAAQNII